MQTKPPPRPTPAETPSEHLRNALQIIALLDVPSDEDQAIGVHYVTVDLRDLAAIHARVEAALKQLDDARARFRQRQSAATHLHRRVS